MRKLILILLLFCSLMTINLAAATDTTTIQDYETPFDPLDEAEELWRAHGGMLFGIVLLFIVVGIIIYVLRKAH